MPVERLETINIVNGKKLRVQEITTMKIRDIVCENSDPRFFITLFNSTVPKKVADLGFADSLEAAASMIRGQARRSRLVPDVIKASDLANPMELSPGVWEMGADEVAYLIKQGSEPDVEDLMV